jgi:hypothetical protein
MSEAYVRGVASDGSFARARGGCRLNSRAMVEDDTNQTADPDEPTRIRAFLSREVPPMVLGGEFADIREFLSALVFVSFVGGGIAILVIFDRKRGGEPPWALAVGSLLFLLALTLASLEVRRDGSEGRTKAAEEAALQQVSTTADQLRQAYSEVVGSAVEPSVGEDGRRTDASSGVIRSGGGDEGTPPLTPNALPFQPGPRNPAEFVVFWETTYQRIVQYHAEAHRQLRSSYRLAQMSAIAGFLLVAAIGVSAAFAPTKTQSIAAAAVGAVGAALAAYIGRTFNSTYSRALQRSGAFFHEPVVMARLLAAERLLSEYGDSDSVARAEALSTMISAAVNFESGAVPDPDIPA